MTKIEVEAPLLDADEQRLNQMGYKQELKRDLSLLSNLAVSFSIISIMTGITGTFGSTGLMYGGPVGIVYGWLLVSFFTIMVGLAMSEICSAYPTSGGLYFWAYQLAGPKHGPLASWVTGWLNLLGQFAVTAGVAFTSANLTAAMILIATGGPQEGGYVCTPRDLLCIYGAYLLVQGLLNTFSLSLLVTLSQQQQQQQQQQLPRGEASRPALHPNTGPLGLRPWFLHTRFLHPNTGPLGLRPWFLHTRSPRWCACVQDGPPHGYVSMLWNSLGVVVVVVLLPLLAKTHQSAAYVFTHFETDNAHRVGVQNPWWVGAAAQALTAAMLPPIAAPRLLRPRLCKRSKPIFFLGCLLGQYTIASAHMVEETKNAAVSGPVGIVVSICSSSVFGLAYILAMLFSISDPAWVIDPSNNAGGYAAAQIYFDAVNGHIGGTAGKWGGIALLMVPLGAMFFCGLSCVTGNSRMLYAFSRDGAVPFSSVWHYVDPNTQNPTYAVWAMVTLSFILGLPMLHDLQAFNAILSISAIGLYLSYAAPILMRATMGRGTFVRGPFHLGRFSLPVCWAAISWVAFITVLFCLPIEYPINDQNFNYAPVALLAVLSFALGWWMLGARKWFKGPVSNLTEEEQFEILHAPMPSVP
ncbi:MAG: hypothetical protein WDW38_005556 [Sanguina aurantia]